MAKKITKQTPKEDLESKTQATLILIIKDLRKQIMAYSEEIDRLREARISRFKISKAWLDEDL